MKNKTNEFDPRDVDQEQVDQHRKQRQGETNGENPEAEPKQ